MVCPETSSDEPLTPAGRLFLQPETDLVIHCIIRGKNPADMDAIKSAIKSSLMVQHPRFCSLLVRDKNGFEHWRKTPIDIGQHVIVVNNRLDKSGNFIDQTQGSTTTEEDDEAAVNQYVADLSVSSPLSTDKPLWELHVLTAHKCAVFRIHHSLGDGISLMSMLMANCRRADDAEALPRMVPDKKTVIKGEKGRDWFWLFGVLWWFLKMVVFTLLFSMEFVLRSLLVPDEKTAITGGDGVELWPRKLATAKFLLDDMKLIKRAVPDTDGLASSSHLAVKLEICPTLLSSWKIGNVSVVNGETSCNPLNSSSSVNMVQTINDVLLGMVSSGLSRYLDHRTPNVLHEGLRITGVAMVNIRPQPGLQDLSKLMKSNTKARWGNKFGVILIPVYYHKGGNDPLEYLKRAKAMVDKKKHSLEAYFSYKIGDLIMSLLGPKYACMLNYKLLCNTTFTLSNVAGPLEEISLAGNPLSSIKVNTSSLPQVQCSNLSLIVI
ncbi:hypothetical protein Golax_020446 [Gossypium laxum]|uniref:Diacylglycerol O-acyltransferase n=1 Tax=Gossypium laxum TaxID=34288 RepID=A0A7J9AYH6_9ROSI|nr:hypothetical protein [Gossypium laxum]